MSDEEDYMSEKFLTEAEDVRPSLIKNRAKKREVEVSLKKLENTKRQRQEYLERNGKNANEKLQESLQRPLNEDNKGFQLLAKMGYKAGQALGKPTNITDTTENRTRLTVPIGITIKADRGGLGREAALKELAEKRVLLHKERLKKAAGGEIITPAEFRKRSKEKAEERFVQGVLFGCQKTCENLDLENSIVNPDLKWFWPERSVVTDTEEDDAEQNTEKADEDEEAEEYTNSEKLEMLTNYLRTAYLFCFWCGVKYKDDNDLTSNCPGLTRDDH